MLREGPEIDAVALAAGKHVLLEKPPAVALSEIAPLVSLAREAGCTLFAAWHSRFAPGVEPARRLLDGRRLLGVTVTWKEDVRVWHPGQDWIWQAGGFGVFDPGINALSILTRILPRPVFVTAASLDFPDNRDAPIAAELSLSDADGLPVRVVFDFRETERQVWDIHVETEQGGVTLSAGGVRLKAGNERLVDIMKEEYPLLYRRFVELASQGLSDVDLAPLQLVADAFMLGRRRQVEAF